MMFIDSIYLLFIAWYVTNIWPSEFGTHKKWYFLFTPSYWSSCCCFSIFRTSRRVIAKRGGSGEGVSLSGIVGDVSAAAEGKVPVEPVSEYLRQQVANNECVDIKGLYKEFETATGKKVAVDGLDLTMYSGQITALLG